MAQSKKKSKKVHLLSYDPVETPEEIIAADKDQKRKEAFQETYKRIAKIIPEYFKTQSNKRKNSTSGGTARSPFSQNIVVTTEKATLETKEVVQEEKQEERERE